MPQGKHKDGRSAAVHMKELYWSRVNAGLCGRCGCDNDRLPKVSCSICAVKYAMEHEKNREKNRLNNTKKIKALEIAVQRLRQQVRILKTRLDGGIPEHDGEKW